MLLLALCAFVGVAGCLIRWIWYVNDTIEYAGGLIAVLAACALIIGLAITPFARIESFAQIQAFDAVKTTLQNARERTGQDLESAAIQLKAAEANQWLATIQYWNSSVLDLWIPDEVDSLRVIQ